MIASKPFDFPRAAFTVALWIALALMIYPLLWMIAGSLKPEIEIFQNPSLIPRNITFDNYTGGWFLLPNPFHIFLINSFIIAGFCIVGNLLACSFAAYAFARLDFKGRKIWFALMLVGIMLPAHVTIVPQYLIFQRLGWVDTFLPLIVPKFLAVDAFFIFLMVQFIRGLPRELDEAATIDGCNAFQVYWHIILPLLVPALITVSIFTFVWTWNDFFSQLLYLTSGSNLTVPLALRQLVTTTGDTGSTWGMLFAMSTVTVVPLLIIFFVFQRRLVEGIATSGLKG